ncbi:MAG: HlyD family efflux transporter periplasmic adaptor subunit [Cyanobacteria bacterium SBLK]|nr:HlyD family efflux transporter periplasmic adaptor subunit [Cyanobacteria bacterium SBLK]
MNGNGFKPKRRRINFADKSSNYQKPQQGRKPAASPRESALVPQSGGALVKAEPTQMAYPAFEQPVVLRQSPLWSRFIIWTIVGVVAFGVGWAYMAEIEQVVQAQGQLKPQGAVKEVQAPLDGVVEEVFVEEGDLVRPGQVLVAFDSTAALAELETSRSLKKSLEEENKLYRGLIESKDPNAMRKAIIELKLPSTILLLTRNREELIKENRFYRAQLRGDGSNLAPDQRARLQVAEAESRSREAASRLEEIQLQEELQQNQVQIADARSTLGANRQMLVQMQQKTQTIERRVQQMQQRTQNDIQGKLDALVIEEDILKDMAPVVKHGGIARYQYEQQRLRVREIQAEIQQIKDNARIERDNVRIERDNARLEEEEQRKQINSGRANIAQLNEERQRLQANVAQARQESINTSSVTIKDIQEAMAQNNKRIAEIDSQLIQAVLNIIVENDKQIKELTGKLLQLEQTLEYQEVTATVGGKVFDLQAYRGFVANPSETLLSIVPEDNLIAEIFIGTDDIGFVREGMLTDVRVDTFSFSEFGDIKGKVLSIGSDALPPDEIHRNFRFPAKVSLDSQYFLIEGIQQPLKSGSQVTVNIKIRENRKVISLFTELFTNSIESLKEVR